MLFMNIIRKRSVAEGDRETKKKTTINTVDKKLQRTGERL